MVLEEVQGQISWDTLAGQASLNPVCHLPDFEIVRGDARDEATLKPMVAKADIVIPLAALVGTPLCDRDAMGAVTINRDAVITLTGLLSGDQRILMPITNSGYGVGEAGKFCTEETPMRLISFMGAPRRRPRMRCWNSVTR